MSDSSAYLLVFHGSRDPRSQAAAESLTQLVRQRVDYLGRSPWANAVYSEKSDRRDSTGDRLAGLAVASANRKPAVAAYLECHPLPLHQQIVQFGQSLLAAPPPSHADPIQLRILPLFLMPGVHVMEDIPAEIVLAQAALGNAIQIRTAAHLGSNPKLSRILTERIAALPMEAYILLAHGSRRPSANQPIETLAERIGAVPAYWSVDPSLETELDKLEQLGLQKIAIVPYFLFSGGITDAIAQTVHTYRQQFPHLTITLTEPVNANPELADLVVDLARF